MRCIDVVMGLSAALSMCSAAAARDVRTSPEPPAIGALAADTLESLPFMCECEFSRGPVHGTTTVFATRRERSVALVMIDGHPVVLHRGRARPSGGLPHPNARAATSNGRARLRPLVLDLRVTGSGDEA